jgi:hypothetical protein
LCSALGYRLGHLVPERTNSVEYSFARYGAAHAELFGGEVQAAGFHPIELTHAGLDSPCTRGAIHTAHRESYIDITRHIFLGLIIKIPQQLD